MPPGSGSSSSAQQPTSPGSRPSCGRRRQPAPAGLTAREVEVLALVAKGRTNREISAALVISEHTVARHLQNVFAKLGVSSRTAASAFAFEHGLSEPPVVNSHHWAEPCEVGGSGRCRRPPDAVIVGHMTTTQAPTMDRATAEQLSARFGTVFETFDAGDLFAPDAFFDLNMPVWRFQLVGARCVRGADSQHRQGQGDPQGPPNRGHGVGLRPRARGVAAHRRRGRTRPDASGSVKCATAASPRSSATAAATGTSALRARHAVEAPMVRP